MLGLPMLLFAASCVPPAGKAQRPAAFAAAAIPASPASASASALPGFQTLSLPVAAEEPPPPEVLAAVIAPGRAAAPFDASRASGDDYESALRCLTAAVYYEARSESEDGQRAVAQVVLNRVRHPAFPNSVCGVVYQGSNRATGCQFSFTCDGSLGRRREPGAWDRAREIAEQALSGSVYAPVGVATHYHTTSIRAWWAASMAHAVTVGSHIFYRWRGEWGDPTSLRKPYAGVEGARQPAQVTIAAAGRTPPQTVLGVVVHRGAEAAPPAIAGTDRTTVRVHRSGGAEAVRVAYGSDAAAPAVPGASDDASAALLR